MDILESAMLSLPPALLAVACATVALLAAHIISLSARPVTIRWALGALLFWLAGARLWAWLSQGTSLPATSWPGHLWSTGVAPAGGLIALLAWTLWYCRQRPVLRQRLCILVMVASGLWWGLEQWREGLQTSLPAALPTLTFESLEGHSVTPANDDLPRYFLLWRSDCHSCRQWLQRLAEWPVKQRPALALVNQGEPLLSVIRYLDQHPDQQLGLEDAALLLDPRQRLLALTGSHHLPALLYVAADNTLIRVHDLSAIMVPDSP
ncbi:hypothetical protein GCM10010082_21410 [Kushneria pakistanensis]|uniref:Redoxin domain-containing protein n=1 Tax=Kushneria pakistanensis TaxID=1508770 RepID=A0ABQ3FKW2_9GAMM|nr:hypothetical protein [Kushneria pakistanensis]GHC27908.1 hypothetical protein GCM10010082_21410 [Kushneria pakistanensis]